MIFHHSVPVNFGSVRDSKKVIAFFPSSLAFFAQVFLNFSREEKFFFFSCGFKVLEKGPFPFFFFLPSLFPEEWVGSSVFITRFSNFRNLRNRRRFFGSFRGRGGGTARRNLGPGLFPRQEFHIIGRVSRGYNFPTQFSFQSPERI